MNEVSFAACYDLPRSINECVALRAVSYTQRRQTFPTVGCIVLRCTSTFAVLSIMPVVLTTPRSIRGAIMLALNAIPIKQQVEAGGRARGSNFTALRLRSAYNLIDKLPLFCHNCFVGSGYPAECPNDNEQTRRHDELETVEAK